MQAARQSGLLSLAVGNTTAQVAALLRYTILARILGPEQLGLAAILILVAQFFEQVTDVGLDRFLVQSRAGNSRSVNAAVHGVLVMRGLAMAGAMALASGALAQFFHYPQMQDGLLLLAIAPAISGFAHFDFRRVQRHHDFGAEGRLTTASELASLAAIIIVALATRSFVAVAYALIVRAAAMVVMSHLVARRPYRIGFSRSHAPAMFAFGLPLMLNGVLLFVTGQGDRLFIGNQIGAAELGHYSAIVLLIFYPATMLSRLLQSINLPIIAAAHAEPARRAPIVDRVAGQSLLLAIAMAAGFAALAPVAVPLLFGARFALPIFPVAMIGVLQSARFVRLWPTTVALATGNSQNVLANSVARLIAFPLAVVFVRLGGGLLGVVLAFTLAEFFAFAVSMVMLHRQRLGSARRDWQRLGLLAASFCGIALITSGAGQQGLALLGAGCAVLLGAAALAGASERAAIASLAGIVQRMAKRGARAPVE